MLPFAFRLAAEALSLAAFILAVMTIALGFGG